MAYDWNTMPIPRYSGAMLRRVALENTTWLPIRISPASGVTRPATQRSRVVFPEPLGPRSTKNSLSPTSMSTPRSAATLVVCPGNVFSTPCTLITESPSVANDHRTRSPGRHLETTSPDQKIQGNQRRHAQNSHYHDRGCPRTVSLPCAPDEHRQSHRAPRYQQCRHGEFTIGQKRHPQPCVENRRHHQRP